VYGQAVNNTVVRGNLVPDAHLAALLLQNGLKPSTRTTGITCASASLR
jgi:hypothetical protein